MVGACVHPRESSEGGLIRRILRGPALVALCATVGACTASGSGTAPTETAYGTLEAPTAPLAGASPNVVVLVIDCLRADHMGAYGYDRDTTPHLDRLAAEGARFEHVLAASNWTRPSVASLFTGLSPSQHQVPGIEISRDVAQEQIEARRAEADEQRVLAGNALSDELLTLAEVFAAAGFDTGAFLHQAQMPDYLGFDQGFDRYDLVQGKRNVVDEFGRWAADRPGEGAPFFAYLHVLALHYPYIPAPPQDLWRTRFELLPAAERGSAIAREMRRRELGAEDRQELIDLYDGVLLGVDELVPHIEDLLERLGSGDNTLLAVTSDHGESFYERGRYKHAGTSLHAELVRIPWLLRHPGASWSGTVIDTPVALVDIMPTLTDLAGIGIPSGIAGRSAVPLLFGEALPNRPLLAETTTDAAIKALVWKGRKFVFNLATDEVEIYDLEKDPGDLHDLAAHFADADIEAARAVLADLLLDNADFAANLDPETVTMSPAEVRRLRALGYLR